MCPSHIGPWRPGMSFRGALVTALIEREVLIVSWTVYDGAALHFADSPTVRYLSRGRRHAFFAPGFDRSCLGEAIVGLLRGPGAPFVFSLTILHGGETNENIRRAHVQVSAYNTMTAIARNMPTPRLVVMVSDNVCVSPRPLCFNVA